MPNIVSCYKVIRIKNNIRPSTNRFQVERSAIVLLDTM